MEGSLPLVSIVLPVYKPNPGLFGAALESIGKQTYSRLELIISMDGDNDGSEWEEEAKRISGVNQFVLVYHKGEAGIFSNINYALQFATGEYVQLFSQDDCMYPHFIEQQVETLRKNPPVAMVFSAFDVIDVYGKDVTRSVHFTYRPKTDRLISSEEAMNLFIEFGCLPGNISPVMLRRSVFMTYGLFDEEMPYAGDFEYWVRLSSKSELFYLHNPGLQIRKHDDQASMMISNRQLLFDLVRVYRKLLDTVPKENRRSKVHHINRKVGSAFMHHAWVSVWKGKGSIRTISERWTDLQQFPFNSFLASTYYGISIPSRLLRRISK